MRLGGDDDIDHLPGRIGSCGPKRLRAGDRPRGLELVPGHAHAHVDGHPIHPMLVVLPLGLWIAALAFTLPLLRVLLGQLVVVPGLFDLHERNVNTATEYRARVLAALVASALHDGRLGARDVASARALQASVSPLLAMIRL